MNIRIVLADDHTMMRDGLRSILERESDIEIVGEASNGREALRLSEDLAPDIVVIDIGMPELNGVEATRRIRSASPGTRVIALSTHSDKRYIIAMLEAGAAGYVLKDCASDELLRAIRSVHGKQKYLSAAVAATVVDSYVSRDFPTEGATSMTLGAREREVLQLLAEGRTSPQIGEALNISNSTVEAHRRNIMKKLDLHSVAELTKYAVREGLTSL